MKDWDREILEHKIPGDKTKNRLRNSMTKLGLEKKNI